MAATSVREPDLDALERDAAARATELREQARRMAPEALKDPRVAEEMRSVSSEPADAERTIAQIELAREEGARRESEAREQAEAKRRRAALAKARQLQVEREAAARRVDRAFKAAAAALTEWERACREQGEQIRVAGLALEGVRVAPLVVDVEGAMRHSLHAAQMPPGLTPVLNPNARARPLSEADAKPVEPAAKR
jgi:hypothetical protein